MKKILLLSAVLAGSVGLYSFMPSNKKATVNSYKVTTEKSKIEWIGSKKSGYHNGAFMLKDGEVNISDNKLEGGRFTIDMSGIKVLDAAGPKLEGHLKAADFFEVDKYPTATFEITTVDYTDENNVEIVGVLMIKDVKVPLKFPAVIRGISEKGFFAQAFFTLDSRLLPITDKYSNADVPLSIHLFAGQ